jgi:tetratricopeptide (TPR) repeat protein
MNVGHTAKAIKKIKDIKKDLRKELPAEAAAMIGGDHNIAASLLLSETESWVKMALGEMWHGDRDSAKDNLEAAEKSYRAIISDAAASIERERAREKLAVLYQTRVFFDIQMRGDAAAAAAAADSAALGEILDKGSHANPHPEVGSRRCPACDFWKRLQDRRPRIQADVAAAEGRLDQAVEGYRKLLSPPDTTNETTETPAQKLGRKLEGRRDRSYILYRLALALEKRGSDADLVEASQHLDEAKATYEELHRQDPTNWWWPLVCQWIDRARGQTFMKHQKYHDAAMAFADAVAHDKELIEFEDSPRAEAELDRDKTALAKAEYTR